jgi:hypothetical protein
MISLENLVNKTVRHIIWGQGVIESVTERYFTVRFYDINYGEKRANFKFPSAFNAGYLNFDN